MKGIGCFWKVVDSGTIACQRSAAFICICLLFFVLAAAGSEGKRGADELFLDNQFYSALGPINGDLAELMWLHCGVELINAKESVEDLELHIPEKKSGINDEIISSTFLAKEDIQKAIGVLHPEIEHTLLDCLRKKNLQFLVPGEEGGSRNWYTKYLDFFFARTDAPRRRYLLQSDVTEPTPSPAFGSHTPSPPPSPGLSPSTSQGPVGSDVQPTDGQESSADSSTTVQSHKQHNSNRAVIIAVVVTAAVTFFFAALLFCCYYRICGSGSGVGRNDERPLLSLSLSDYSVGSTHKSFAVGINNEKLDSHSFRSSLNDTKRVSSLNNFYVESNILSASKVDTGMLAGAAKTSAEDSAQMLTSTLKPPPGRVGNPPGLPPLKPPPGKVTTPLPPPPPVPLPSLKPTSGSARPPPPGPPPPGPPPPPIPSGIKAGPRPPPPPKVGVPPPRPPAMGLKPPRPSPLGPNHTPDPVGEAGDADGPKTKLKPFFWDKVLANPDQSMVWHQIKSGSFQFSEEMIETLFGYAPPEKNKKEAKKESSFQDPPTQYIQIIDSKKAQNLSILLRALNVTTEEVCDALLEGNELPSELLQNLLRMAPTTEEELKLRLFNGEVSRLGPADRFLKVLVETPFAFKRLESLLFMCTFQEEVSLIKDSFTTLEAACAELRKSRLFLKLLEAVLKTGNRMNDGTFRGGAQAFKLDTLLKLADVKGTDGKTTLLHFVVREIIRSEGVRAARTARESQSMSSIRSEDLLEDPSQDPEEHFRNLGLQVVSGLGNELENLKKAAVLDFDSLTGAVSKLGHQLVKSRDFLNSDMKSVDEENGFHLALKSFVQNAEVDVMSLLDEEKRTMAMVKSTADYFHGNAGKDEGLRLFVIVRDFLIIVDKVCKEVKDAPKKPNKTPNKEGSTVKPPSDKTPNKEGSTVKPPSDKTPNKEGSTVKPPSEAPRQNPDPRQRLFPAIQERRMDDSSSDDDTS